MDQDNLKQIADEVISVVAGTAGKAAEVAGKAATKAAEIAGETATEFGDRAVKFSKAGVEAASPTLHQWADIAQDQAEALLAKSKVSAEEGKEASLAAIAALAAKGQDTLADVEKHAKAAAKPAKSSGRAGRVLGWTAAAAGVASVGYLLWRRSRPIEDPWAEEYWVDLQTDADLSDVPDQAEEVKDEVEDKAEEVVDEVADKAKEVAEEATE